MNKEILENNQNYTITLNPNEDHVSKINEGLAKHNFKCPCMPKGWNMPTNKDAKTIAEDGNSYYCMCRFFREAYLTEEDLKDGKTSITCHCMKYTKTLKDEFIKK